MEEGIADNALYARLMAIKPDDLSPNAWTVKAGVSRNFFHDVRKRGNANHDSLVKILNAVGMNFADFDSGNSTVRTEVRRSPVADFRGDASARRDLPLAGTGAGGELPDIEGLDEASADLIELDLGEVLDYLERPGHLKDDRDAYALTMIGDSMSPRFEPGERIMVSPRSPVSIGDYVVVQLRGREGEQERVKLVLVKRLLRRSPTFIELGQFNPEISFRVPAERLARDGTNRHRIHKVVGSIFRP